MNTAIPMERQWRTDKQQKREMRTLNLGSRLNAHFGSGFLHSYKRTRYTPVDTNRIDRFIAWLDSDESTTLFSINLNEYAEAVLANNAEVSKVSALGTIRGCIKRFVRSTECLNYISDMIDLWEDKDDESQAITIAQTVQKNILSRVTSDRYIRTAIKRDHTQAILKGTRITHADMKYMIEGLWSDFSLRGLQHSAVIALLGGFGLRSEEALNVHVEDFDQGHLRVRSGKGAKERSVPYADNYYYVKVIEKWLAIAGITEGKVLRSINRWGSIGSHLGYRGLKYILEDDKFMVEVKGELIAPLPHDYRKSASRMWYEAGMSIYDIAQNLGHTNADGQLNIKLTSQYIGLTGSASRELVLS